MESNSGIERIREGLYVKQDMFGYRIVHPIRNDDGSYNWFNLWTGGSWWNLIKVFIFLVLICFLVWSYKHDLAECWSCVEDPCEYCSCCQYIPPGVNMPLRDVDLSPAILIQPG